VSVLIEESMPDADEHDAIKEAIRRDGELASGEVQGFPTMRPCKLREMRSQIYTVVGDL